MPGRVASNRVGEGIVVAVTRRRAAAAASGRARTGMLSTRALHLLPDVAPLRRTCQAIAVLDAVLSPDPQFRYYAFDHAWAPDRHLAAMRNDSGDEWFVLFSPAGAVLKGFVPDAIMAGPVHREGKPWPGVLDAVPPAFREIASDDRLAPRRATFCAWRTTADAEWQHGPVRFPPGADPDGSKHLMAVLDGDPVTYARWAEQHYEIEIPFIEVRRVYLRRPMTPEMVKGLNPHADWAAVVEDLRKIDYPVQE